MFIPQDTMVPCVKLAVDADLDDVSPWAVDFDQATEVVEQGKSPAMFIFAENSEELESLAPKLKSAWDKKLTFWIFYPKKPHLGTDLGRDAVWKQLKRHGVQGTRQVAVGDKWSCMYFKNSGKSDYVEIVAG
ncbi:hypothetical protein AKACHI_09230 [Aquiluna sp. KACHI24]|nr:hypothetical protein AKACHI_09230 [Aquiluna sp. KACHI24]